MMTETSKANSESAFKPKPNKPAQMAIDKIKKAFSSDMGKAARFVLPALISRYSLAARSTSCLDGQERTDS